MPSLTKWKTVPPGRGQGGRTWVVRTKTGVWNGASVGPELFASVEHSFAENGRTGAGVGPLEEVVVRSGFAAVAQA